MVSAALAAGAITAWAVWTVPAPVRLLPVRPVTARVSSRPLGRTGLSPGAARTSASARPPGSPAPAVPVSPPVALAIPSAGISARVVPEGLGPGGTLDIPPPQQVGWYERGAVPGQDGTTLIAGHIDDDGVPGAFLRLNAVPTGATVRITLASGRVAAYIVRRRLVLPQSGLAGSGLLAGPGTPQLVMITCGGDYDTSTHLYLDNIVLVGTPDAS